ncbi:hypothetical protein BH20ACI2_BH20ACI2_26240 [soil metagenome]
MTQTDNHPQNLSPGERIVTIFGGSKFTEDSPEYQEAKDLGGRLARAGFTICTGGYLGIMEAASRGAREHGGRVYGIVMNQFRSEPNRYLTDKVATNHFYERLQNLITRSVGFVALRGGMGTVTEISLVWNKLQTGVIGRRPLVLIGECWKPVVEAWKTNLVVSDGDVSYLDFAPDAETAAGIIALKSEGVVI